jgi:hypothetical protein
MLESILKVSSDRPVLARSPHPVEDQYDQQDGDHNANGNGRVILLHEFSGPISVLDRQKPLQEVAEPSAQRDCQNKSRHRYPEGACGKHEDFEGGRWRQDGRDHDGKDPIFAVPGRYFLNLVFGEFPSQQDFAALPANSIQQQTAYYRSQSGHQTIVKHVMRVLDGEGNNEEIVDFRQREKGRVKESNNEQFRTVNGAE